jgi:4a-hydroxytetrahydrobiopterin dehydratase
MNANAIKQAMDGVQAWVLAEDGRSISRTFKFADFIAAFGFMTRSALIAEKLDHHPEWSNVYRTVAVTLTTHDAKGLTDLDFSLATAMDRLAAQ